MFKMWKKLRKRCIIEGNSNGEEQNDNKKENLQLGQQDIETNIEIEDGTEQRTKSKVK